MWLAHGAQIDENYYRKEIKVADEGLALPGLRLTAYIDGVTLEQNRGTGAVAERSCL
jgi:hypothetical protein